MNYLSTIIQMALLWCLITFFSKSRNSEDSFRETRIVIIGMLMVSIVFGLFLGKFLGILVLPIQIGALYLLVDKVCETPRRVTLKICGYYLAFSFLINLTFFALFR